MKRQMISLLTVALLGLSILGTSAVSADSGPFLPEVVAAVGDVNAAAPGQWHIESTALPMLSAYCDATAARSLACFFPQPEHGVMLTAERQADGTWQVMAAFEMPVDDAR